jgi:hypothetical protein
MSNRNRHGTCVYCGREKKVTRDHVPPKLLFPAPLPPNLLTVPCCRTCNASFQKDDEYTRLVAATAERASENDDAKSKLPAIRRSLERPDGKGFMEYLARQTSPSTVLGPDGKPMSDVIDVDRQRVNATEERIIRGLFFIEMKELLHPNSLVKVGVTTDVHESDPVALQFARAYQACPDRRDREIGSAFNYVACFGEGISFWLMQLYGYFFWAGTTDSRHIIGKPAPTQFPVSALNEQ